MELALVFIIFALCMALSLILGISMILPLVIGFVLFVLLAMRRGFTLRQILLFAKSSLKDSFIVIGIMLTIGCLTGLWRSSGTVAYFVTLGVSLIPPRLFLLAAFLLTSLMSYALGTSFGVTATAGVILITIARAGGINTVLAAGAVFSGVYVGDRGSPAASSGNLVAVLTHTDMRRNVRDMLKCSVIPFLLCCAAYTALSFIYPMQTLDTQIPGMLRTEFNLNFFTLIPAVLMIVLPFCNVSIRVSMTVSLISAFIVSLTVQHNSFLACLRAMLLGYRAADPALADMLSGGGLVSMLEVSMILIVSGTYGGIFRGTGLLARINGKLSAAAERIGRFPVMLLISAGVCALFCNQTIGAIMQSQLSDTLYGSSEEERRAKMLDMENSVILVSGLVPWCIASSVPLAMMGADFRSIPVGFYLWLVPLFWLFRSLKKKITSA